MFPLCSAGQSSSAGPVNDPAVAVGWAEPGHPAAASPATPQTTGIQQIQLSRAAHQLSHHQPPAAELLGPAGAAADVPQQLVQGAGASAAWLASIASVAAPRCGVFNFPWLAYSYPAR